MAELDAAIQEFVAEHPNGWSHWDWEQFLAGLSERNVKISSADEVGSRLEAERLRHSLQGVGVAGLGPKRVEAIVTRFGSVSRLREASPADLASIPTIPRRLAEETLARISAY